MLPAIGKNSPVEMRRIFYGAIESNKSSFSYTLKREL